jgi:hypothetical protein
MTKQERLNQFLLDLASFLGTYYTGSDIGVFHEMAEGAVRVKLTGPAESVLDIWAYGEEITIEFGECHWHVYDISDPCCYEKIHRQTVDGVLDVLNGRLSTYSCWRQGRIRVGGTCSGHTWADAVADRPDMSSYGADEARFKTWGQPTEIHPLMADEKGR